MDRVPTGITGFDKLIEGGFPDKAAVLIAGIPGTGKSVFGLQYLYNGIDKYNEPGLYVSLEDFSENIRIQGKQFGMDIEKFEKKGKLKILEIPLNVIDINLIETLKKNIKAIGAKRLVIDSLSVLILNSNQYMLPMGEKKKVKDVVFDDTGMEPVGDTSIRGGTQFIYNTVSQIRMLGISTLLITDNDGTTITKDGVSEYIVDGIVLVGVKDFGKTVVRTLEIKKMRRTKIIPGMRTLEFTKKGIVTKDFDY